MMPRGVARARGLTLCRGGPPRTDGRSARSLHQREEVFDEAPGVEGRRAFRRDQRGIDDFNSQPLDTGEVEASNVGTVLGIHYIYGPGTTELRGELRALLLLRWRVD